MNTLSEAPPLERKGIYLWPKLFKYLQHISDHDLPPNAKIIATKVLALYNRIYNGFVD
jgi:hypothetical protein